MKSPKHLAADLDLQDAVEEELSWEPRVDATRIRVSAEKGAVVLSGSVDSYPQKPAAVHAAERVHGVKAVADEIEVVTPDSVKHTDADIAAEIARRRDANKLFPDSVVVEVSKGRVKLRGVAATSFAREEAAQTVRRIEGVRAVSNEIDVRPHMRPDADEVARRIEQALVHQAYVEASTVRVTADDKGVVRLAGTVGSLAARRLAELAAETAPGVTEIVDDIDVTLPNDDDVPL